MDSNRQSRFICSALLGAVSIAAGDRATAQSENNATPKENMDEVVVTGSRIAAPNATSTSPIQVVTRQEIQVSGKTDITDIISQLPQNFSNDLGQDLGNRTPGLTTAGGVATADLRGLGPNRTLVLVNGRRLGIGSPYTFIQAPAPDLDQIPAALVERVEVLTGGASATYGSDAIAGVINFIMKKNFEGFQVDGNLGANWHENHNSYSQDLQRAVGYTPLTGSGTDGRTMAINVLAGTGIADGKGNITAYFGYMKTDPVTSAQRDFGGCQLNANAALDGARCFGSINSNFWEPQTGPNAFNDYSVKGNNFIDFGTEETTPPARFNSQRYIYMQRGDERYTAGFMGHIDLNDHFQAYTEFGYMNDRSHQVVAPAAAFTFSNPNDPISGNYNINCSNPLMSAQQALTLCTQAEIDADAAAIASGGTPVTANVAIGRRNIEGGGRSSDYEHSNYRAAVGGKGDISDAWNYDAYFQYYYTTFFTTNDKYLNFTAIDQALLVKRDANGNPVCISGGRCVPWNIFSDGGVTDDQLNFLYLSGTGYGTTTLKTIHGEISGKLDNYGIKLPSATEGLALNFGYEHRNENVKFTPDAGLASGQLSGFGSAAVGIDNSVSVNEGFLEVRVPLVQDKPGVKDLIFDTAYRTSDYTSTGRVGTYKVEMQYAPVDSLRFRGSFQRAVRSPTVVELYNGELVGLTQLGDDPCSSPDNITPATASLADCLHTVPAAEQAAFIARYGNGSTTNNIPKAVLGQLSQKTGGNPNLENEVAKSYTIGFNISPEALPNFVASVDYYKINIDKEVGVVAANVALNTCLATGDPTYCALVVRQHNTGGLTGNNIAGGGYIIQQNLNIGGAEVSGVDVQTAYKLSLPGEKGALAFALNGAYLLTQKTTPLPGAHTYDCAGLYGNTCGTVNPHWHHNLRTTWSTPWNFDVAMTWRFLSPVKLDNNDSDPTLHGAEWQDPATGLPRYKTFGARFPSFSYFDLAGIWNMTDDIQLRAGINNVMDKDPPLGTVEVVGGGAANTYSTYDAMGRQMFLSFTAKF
jgi:outer membrane receptor protein involved in Fe transport